ncbi:MAG: hypothetical protein KME11_11015 [Timaviella obliquedivisa GSE-PSE-MK23-08B]|jgi:hypothetical protein|nr:hypothetical protein [Timaviella obliquedivisa GSE-PSE-MK23-08B]
MREKVNSQQEPEPIKSHAQSLGYTFNRFMVILARLIIMGLIANLTIKAFLVSPEVGFKSIAAIILPLLLTGYISFSNKAHHLTRPSSEVLNVFLYLFSAGWLLGLMVLIRYVIYYSNRSLPIGEFALSITLSIFVFISERIAFKSLVACAYGLVSGFLFFILFFGVPA